MFDIQKNKKTIKIFFIIKLLKYLIINSKFYYHLAFEILLSVGMLVTYGWLERVDD